MNCQKIREVILTDYIDNELEEKTQTKIKNHLANCPACRNVEKALKAMIVEPLRNSESFNPPAVLWSKIRNKLAQKELEDRDESAGGWLFAFRPQWLNIVLFIPLLVFAALAGNYFAHGVLGTTTQQDMPANADLNNNLELSEFNDIPNEQIQGVYSKFIGG